jgi:hypothetical protein
MDGIVASGGHAGDLVAFDISHGLRVCRMHRALLKAARSLMAVEAFTVVIRMIELQGLLRSGDILSINVV